MLNNQGTAIIKFDTSSSAGDFKRRYVNHRIRDRPINIHLKYDQSNRRRSRSRGAMPMRSALLRARTFSGSKKYFAGISPLDTCLQNQ